MNAATSFAIIELKREFSENKASRLTNSDPDFKLLKIAQNDTAKFLKSNPDICVLPADKGNREAVMMTEDYDQKMQTLLSDTDTYTKIKADPTHKYQTSNNNFALRLLDLKLIDYHTANRLRTSTATCPRIYGQPKAHKPELPLRLVVPGMTSPSYELSKYICKIYQASISTKYNISDSRSFCQFINTITIPPNHRMISLDVVSLFTNIPKDLVIRDTINNWDSIKTNTAINLDLFIEVVTFCMDSSYFVFRNQHYHQIAGTAMGNPLSPTLADLIMETLIDTVIRHLSFSIKVLRKYVDDLYLIVPHDKIGDVLKAFNSYHPNIQFTFEEQKEGRLPYLDMTLVRQQDDTIRTEWYMKSIASGRFLNFRSIHLFSQKLNVVYNLIERVYHLSTNMNDIQKRKIIAQQLTFNDYPRSLINRCLNRMNNKLNQKNDNNSSNRESILKPDPTYRSLPYIPQLTPQIIKIFRPNYSNVTIATKSINTVSNLYTRIKDTLLKMHHHNVIYRIPCQTCECTYVGMTRNLLKTRLSGHRSNISKLEELLNAGLTHVDSDIMQLREKTALVAHCIDHDHRFDLTATTILDQTQKHSSLPFLEMIWIYNNNTTEIQGKLDPVSLGVKEVYYRPNGEATVRCDSRESALKLLSTVKANLSEKYNADVQKALKPRVKVAGFTDDITAENFVEKLIQQNNFPQPANLTVIRIVRNEKHTDNPMSAIIETDAKTFEKLMQLQHVNLGWMRCKNV
ncbi:uncharacterized protein LOC131687913 [Topomyia yanbarensis]|uniref:uncharacterized protein LOC131687913 n=1 Tax=Topomyia yanbarensis TaxID=2498891 RepID=UPI00273C3A17|nr:uncharacterized protein LOC131687913 [Topomyia yanbarensis]